MLAGCAQNQPRPVTAEIGSPKTRISCDVDVQPEDRVELEMVDTLMSRDLVYAALAQLQKHQQRNEEYWQRYGQLLAKTDDMDGARDVFTQMRDQCNSGEAYHGLGMIALKQGYLSEALTNFKEAVSRLPASASVRNDYGYALLLEGDFPEAQRNLRTSLELQNGSGAARQNLAVAYILAGNKQGLALLRDKYHFTDDEMAYAHSLADQMRK
ncbi:hypothetical protein A11A3_09140 [Alcanivorax hongdengensis A-11-3]|uniref:Uncharacterized protein n=2 Tax=Alcanivorax hongdengensis TaxID=519051 RepID=L0WC51_9GAMM|nr:hypothetical protein A11A3_09140 [Alcanivorax hongdengensis A-11-3]